MKPILLFSLCYLCCWDAGWAQISAENRGILWRGFEQNWTYNHRINRVGDYASLEASQPMSVHTSASGMGADSTRFVSHFSFVESPRLSFQTGKVRVSLNGREKKLITKEIEVSVPADICMKGKEQYITLLNGFDLQATARADKLQLLRVSLENAEYATELQEFRFKIHIALVANCQSIECSQFRQQTNYELDLHFIIIGGKDEDVLASERTVSKSYTWDRKIGAEDAPEKYNLAGRGNHAFSSAALGIRGFMVTLDAAHWMVEYHQNVTPLNYDPRTGRIEFLGDLFFKEWVPNMKFLAAYRKHAKFSKRKRGWCVVDMDVVLLQFSEATVSHQKNSGSMFWGGMNASPEDERAVRRTELRFPVYEQSSR